MNLYKKLWSVELGRPSNKKKRDVRRKYPTPWMLGVMVVSAAIGYYFWGWMLLVFFCGVLIGIIWGHLWWGTKDIPDQPGE